MAAQRNPNASGDVSVNVSPLPSSASSTAPSVEATSYQFARPIMDRLEDLAARYRTSVDKLIARAVATEVFLDEVPHGTKLLLLKPDGKYEEVVRPDPRDIGR